MLLTKKMADRMTGNDLLESLGLLILDSKIRYPNEYKTIKTDNEQTMTVWLTVVKGQTICHFSIDGKRAHRNPDGSTVLLPHTYHIQGPAAARLASYTGK